jgi:hypothetical protein
MEAEQGLGQIMFVDPVATGILHTQAGASLRQCGTVLDGLQLGHRRPRFDIGMRQKVFTWTSMILGLGV